MNVKSLRKLARTCACIYLTGACAVGAIFYGVLGICSMRELGVKDTKETEPKTESENED